MVCSADVAVNVRRGGKASDGVGPQSICAALIIWSPREGGSFLNDAWKASSQSGPNPRTRAGISSSEVA